MRMTTEEAFVKVLQMHGIEHAFGIIGSAFMPISDLFPKAGITFWDVAHETNGGLICGRLYAFDRQDGDGDRPKRARDYRVRDGCEDGRTGIIRRCLLVTPQAANKPSGRAASRKVEQMALFRDMVGYLRRSVVMRRAWRKCSTASF